jgi:hypothetical protein
MNIYEFEMKVLCQCGQFSKQQNRQYFYEHLGMSLNEDNVPVRSGGNVSGCGEDGSSWVVGSNPAGV